MLMLPKTTIGFILNNRAIAFTLANLGIDTCSLRSHFPIALFSQPHTSSLGILKDCIAKTSQIYAKKSYVVHRST
jgi:hypothetical protein